MKKITIALMTVFLSTATLPVLAMDNQTVDDIVKRFSGLKSGEQQDFVVNYLLKTSKLKGRVASKGIMAAERCILSKGPHFVNLAAPTEVLKKHGIYTSRKISILDVLLHCKGQQKVIMYISGKFDDLQEKNLTLDLSNKQLLVFSDKIILLIQNLSEEHKKYHVTKINLRNNEIV